MFRLKERADIFRQHSTFTYINNNIFFTLYATFSRQMLRDSINSGPYDYTNVEKSNRVKNGYFSMFHKSSKSCSVYADEILPRRQHLVGPSHSAELTQREFRRIDYIPRSCCKTKARLNRYHCVRLLY